VIFGESEARAALNDAKSHATGDRFMSATLDPSIPADILLAFMTVLPEDVYLLETPDQAARWGIDVYGFPPPTKLSTRMLMETCFSVSTDRCILNVRSTTSRQQDFMCNANLEILREAHDRVTGYQLPLAAVYETSKITKWPKDNWPIDHSVQVFSMKRKDLDLASQTDGQGVYCEIKGHWHRDQLINLDIYTFNGTGRRSEEDEFKRWTDRKDYAPVGLWGEIPPHLVGFKEAHLRPWWMLPIGTQLKSLGSKPWGWLEEGENFFDKPPSIAAR
jgi:hypothetical protein